MQLSAISEGVRKALPLKKCGAVIVAGGNASRMQGIDKITAPIAGIPMIVRTVEAFQKAECIQEIVVVTREDLILTITDLTRDFDKVKAVVVGGSSRQESVSHGLSALSKNMKLAAVHDGARPFITEAVIDRTVRAAHTYGAAAPAVPVKDTIKVVKGAVIDSTPDRASLRAVQTPQVFDIALLKGALQKAAEDKLSVTDDCSAAEHMGMRVKIVDGDERNIKITTPLDLKLAELLLEETL